MMPWHWVHVRGSASLSGVLNNLLLWLVFPSWPRYCKSGTILELSLSLSDTATTLDSCLVRDLFVFLEVPSFRMFSFGSVFLSTMLTLSVYVCVCVCMRLRVREGEGKSAGCFIKFPPNSHTLAQPLVSFSAFNIPSMPTLSTFLP